MNDDTDPIDHSRPDGPGEEIDDTTATRLGWMLRDVDPVDGTTRRRHLDAALAEFDALPDEPFADRLADHSTVVAPVVGAAATSRARRFRVVAAAAAVVAVAGVGIGVVASSSSSSKEDMATTAESARDADSSATFDKSAESGAVADAGGSPDEYATTAPGAPAPVNGAIVTPTTASLPDLGSFDDDRTLAASVDALVDDLTGSGPASDGSDRATNDAVPTTTASPPGFPAADPAESCPSAVDPDAVPFARATVDGHPVTVFGGPAADRMGVRTFLVDLTDCAVRTL